MNNTMIQLVLILIILFEAVLYIVWNATDISLNVTMGTTSA